MATPPDSTEPSQAPTTTSPPPPAAPRLVASDESGSRYTVDRVPFTVQVSFTTDCWIEVRRDGGDGEVLFAGVMGAGDTLEYTEGWIWMRLGFPPAVTVAVNGVALPPLADAPDPFDVEIGASPPAG